VVGIGGVAGTIVNAAGEEERDRLSPRANLLSAVVVLLLLLVGMWLLPRGPGDVLLAAVALYVTIGARLVHRTGSESWGLPRPLMLPGYFRSLSGRGRAWLLVALAGLGLWTVLSVLPAWLKLLQRAGVRRYWPIHYAELADEPLLAVLFGLGVFVVLALFVIRWDRWRSAPRLLLWGAVLCAGVLGIALLTGRAHRLPELVSVTRFPEVFFYSLWAILQQYCFLGFFNGRLRRGLGPGRHRLAVALATGAVFATLHPPAWWLVLATFPVGVVYGWLFQEDRYRNLFVIGVTHGIAGTLYGALIPGSMAVGPW
jgi:hypothetical protein